MKQLIFLMALMLCSTGLHAQFSKQKKSTGPGTLFFYWGYNRSIYSPSSIRFIGPGYDFKLKGVEAVDRPSQDFSEYVSVESVTPLNLDANQASF